MLCAVAVLRAWLAWERSVVMERRTMLNQWTASGTVLWMRSGWHSRAEASLPELPWD